MFSLPKPVYNVEGAAAPAPAPASEGAPPPAAPAEGAPPSPTGDPHAASPVGTPITGTAPDPNMRAGQPTPETPSADLNGSDQPAGEPNTDWAVVLNDGNREVVQQKGWKDVNDVVASYSALEKKVGEKTLAPPSDEADKAEWDTFYQKVGRPNTAEDYSFSMPEGVPENMPYDQNFALDFRNMAHEAGLSQKQATQLHDAYVRRMGGDFSKVIETGNERVTAAHEALVKEWGETETDGYRQNHEFARRAMSQLGLKDALAEAGVIQAQTGMVTDARVASALARVGKAMFAEDTLYSGPANTLNNPFSEKTFNQTEQHLLIRNDPGRAATLIRAAGQKPEDYGLTG